MKLSTSLNNYQEYLNIETNYDQLFSDFLLSDIVKELYESSKGKTEFGRWVSQMKKNKNYKVNQKRLNQWVEIRREELNEKFNELSKNQGLNEIRIEKGQADRVRKQMEKMKEEYEATIENMKALHENKVKYLEGTIECLRKTNFRNINTIKKLKERKVETIIQETIEEDPVEEIIIEVEPEPEPEPEVEPEPEPEKVIIDSSDEEGPELEEVEIELLKMYNTPEPVQNEFLDSDKIDNFFENNMFKERFYEDFIEGELSYKEIVQLINDDFIENVGEPIKESDKKLVDKNIKICLEDIEIDP
jgi:hypothetical protein